MFDCPLNSAELDLVTENDHLNDYCYCSQCTCNQHKCAKPNRKVSPKSMYRTYYKDCYKKHDLLPIRICSASPLKKSQFRLESETTSGHDFKPWPIEQLKVDVSSRKTDPKFRFSSNSTYKQDFPVWGNCRTEGVKGRSSSLAPSAKFSSTTTYSDYFAWSPVKTAKLVKPSDNVNILGVGNETTPQSTMKASFGKVNITKNGDVARNESSIILPPFPGQYQTITSIYFDHKKISQTIRRVKKII